MCERFTCKPFKELRKKLVDRDVPENRITSYLVETYEITSGRARGLMKKEYHWTFAEAAALAKDLDIPRAEWADYFWPEEVL